VPETALQNADGSLNLDRLAALAVEGGEAESSVQHIMLHHTKTRDSGTQYMLYGAATRDICKMFELIKECDS
jgi:hypothetical protein